MLFALSGDEELCLLHYYCLYYLYSKALLYLSDQNLPYDYDDLLLSIQLRPINIYDTDDLKKIDLIYCCYIHLVYYYLFLISDSLLTFLNIILMYLLSHAFFIFNLEVRVVELLGVRFI